MDIPGSTTQRGVLCLRIRQHDLARRMAVFAAMVEGVDQGIGRIVQHLKATNELENTLILFLSDNGGLLRVGAHSALTDVLEQARTIFVTGEALREIGGRDTHQALWQWLGQPE